MSGPATSLPPEIRALMQSVAVSWEAAGALDLHAQQAYAAAVVLEAWVERHSMTVAIDAIRGATTTVIVPRLDLFFDGDDSRVRSFTLMDRFSMTLPGLLPTKKQQPSAIDVVNGPPGIDSLHPWAVVVTL